MFAASWNKNLKTWIQLFECRILTYNMYKLCDLHDLSLSSIISVTQDIIIVAIGDQEEKRSLFGYHT